MTLPETAVGGGIVVASAVLVAALGYLIRYRERTVLIAGYRPDGVADETGVARLVGGFVLLVSAATAVLGVGMVVLRLPESTWGRIWLGYCAALVVSLPVVNRIARKRYGTGS